MTADRAADPIGADIVALLDSCASTCQLLAEQDEGPYRRGEQPRRRDVTEDKTGSPLLIGLRLQTADGDAVAGTDVEIWHCDADGRYSGYPPNDPSVAVIPSPQRAEYLPQETFLRGRQTTDGAGNVEFRTIYPGWYPGRSVHIHLMVDATRTYISQLYFPENVTAELFARGPYRKHGLPDTTNETDEIFPTGRNPLCSTSTLTETGASERSASFFPAVTRSGRDGRSGRQGVAAWLSSFGHGGQG